MGDGDRRIVGLRPAWATLWDCGWKNSWLHKHSSQTLEAKKVCVCVFLLCLLLLSVILSYINMGPCIYPRNKKRIKPGDLLNRWKENSSIMKQRVTLIISLFYISKERQSSLIEFHSWNEASTIYLSRTKSIFSIDIPLPSIKIMYGLNTMPWLLQYQVTSYF